MPQQILVTGSTGFIGKNIIEQLGGKYALLAPGHRELDLCDNESVERFFQTRVIDLVIHTANFSMDDAGASPQGTVGTNLRMFFNLAKMLTLNQRMIFLGSGAEYDKRRDIAGATEAEFDKRVPADDYGFAKYVCSKYIERSENIANLRCFGVYGKYEQESRFISGAILDVLANRPIAIRQNVYFDFLYVDDLIRIIDYFIGHTPKEKIYNTVSGKRIDLVTLADIIEKNLGSTQGIKLENDGLGKEYTASNARLLGEMGQFEFTELEEGVGTLHQFYKNR